LRSYSLAHISTRRGREHACPNGLGNWVIYYC